MSTSTTTVLTRKTGGRSPHARTRVSNGSEWLPDVDLRSRPARRYRDLIEQIAIDLGGIDSCSEVRMQLIRRFASGAVLAENLEARLAAGEDVDIAEHALLASTLCRLGSRIGIQRIPKNVTPSLSDYLEPATELEREAEE